jgi:pimeloyl-ACP methyl ester carboxylesterase
MPDLQLSETFTLHYEEAGDPEAPAVVLLHGFTASLRMWAAQADALAGEYRVIAPDLRGHGRTTAPESLDEYGIERYAEDVRALLDHLGIEMCALVGCSFGGMIALQFAVTYPERLACLVVSDASPAYERPDYDDRFRDREAGIREQEAYAAKRGTAALGAKVAAGITDTFLAQAIRDRFARLDTNGYLGAARTRRERPDITSLLRERLTMPVMLCDGEDDPVFCALDVMARELPGAHVVAFRGAGHGLPAQRPGPFTDVLFEFLHDVEEGVDVAGRKRI